MFILKYGWFEVEIERERSERDSFECKVGMSVCMNGKGLKQKEREEWVLNIREACVYGWLWS